MKLGKPTIHLHKEEVSGQPTEYKLFCVTWFDETRYVADGYDTLPTAADTNGIFEIDLKVAATGASDLTLMNPVVHMVDLGSLPLTASEPWIHVNVKEGSQLVDTTKCYIDDAYDFNP